MVFHSIIPDLTPCDFYLWGSLKDTMYKTNHTLEKLSNICHMIAISWEDFYLWGSLYKTNHTLVKLSNVCHAIAISWEERQRVNNVLHQYTYFSQEGRIFSICCSTGEY
jgi:hypothetical protein